MERFKPRSLAEQIADALRDQIETGLFANHLPSERLLCGMFGVSRPVVRRALHQLARDGVIRIRRGLPAEIVGRSVGGAKPDSQGRVVLLFNEEGAARLPYWQLAVTDALRRELYAHKVHFELATAPGLNGRRPGPRLSRLLARHRADHWILAGCREPVHRWFYEQRLNVVVMGNPFPDIPFPFVNDDLRATARHAAGIFLGRGHRKVAFMRRDRGTPGELDEEAGFLEAFRATRDVVGTVGTVVRHDGRVEQIHDRLAHLFLGAREQTALLISHAEDALVAMNWFLQAGIRVPKEVSLISFQWESYLERLRPLPAWYYTNPALHARKLCSLILGPVPKGRGEALLLPEFFANQTVAGRSS